MAYLDEVKIKRISRGNYRKDSHDPLDWAGGKWFLSDKIIYFKANWSNFKHLRVIDETIQIGNIKSIHIPQHDFISSKLVFYLKDNSRIELHLKRRREWVDDIVHILRDIKSNNNERLDLSSFINTKTNERPVSFFEKHKNLIIYGIGIGISMFLLMSLIDRIE